MNRKSLLAILIVIALSLMIFSACSKSENTDINEPKTSDSSETSDSNKKNDEESNYNPEGLPIVNEPVTLKMCAKIQYDHRAFNEMEYFKMLEEKTNVKIEWDNVPGESWKEKVSLMINTEQLPDAFYGTFAITTTEANKYGSQGLFIPLNDYIENHSTYLKPIVDKHPEYLSQVTAIDGNIYGLPSFAADRPYTPVAVYINQYWLDQVGKEIPKTTDELEDVLIAFRDAGDLNGNGEDDEQPLAFMFGSWKGIEHIFGAFGLPSNNGYLQVVNDKVVFTAAHESYKKGIEYVHRLYEQDLVDPESFTYSSADYTAKSEYENPSFGVVLSWAMTPVEGFQYVPLPQLTGPEGYNYSYNDKYGMLQGTGFVITKACKYPEVAFRWADYQYEQEIALQAYKGMYGTTCEKVGDKIVFKGEYEEGTSFDTLRHGDAPGNSSIHALTPEMFAKCELAGEMALKPSLDKIYEPNRSDDIISMPGAIIFSEEEMEIVTSIETELRDYVKQISAKWITEGGINEEWDEHIQTLKDMGIDEYLKAYQNAYDRFIK